MHTLFQHFDISKRHGSFVGWALGADRLIIQKSPVNVLDPNVPRFDVSSHRHHGQFDSLRPVVTNSSSKVAPLEAS